MITASPSLMFTFHLLVSQLVVGGWFCSVSPVFPVPLPSPTPPTPFSLAGWVAESAGLAPPRQCSSRSYANLQFSNKLFSHIVHSQHIDSNCTGCTVDIPLSFAPGLSDPCFRRSPVAGPSSAIKSSPPQVPTRRRGKHVGTILSAPNPQVLLPLPQSPLRRIGPGRCADQTAGRRSISAL